MNRQIKFRAYDTKLGHYVSFFERFMLSDSDYIVEQFTGFIDRDGNEIYEGDIIFGETRNNSKQPTFLGKVEFHQPTAQFLARDEEGFTRGLNSFYNLQKKNDCA